MCVGKGEVTALKLTFMFPNLGKILICARYFSARIFFFFNSGLLLNASNIILFITANYLH